MRMEALKTAATLNLPDWCLAAGFLRNLVWDKLHDHETPTTLSDVDLIYFNPQEISSHIDQEYEATLRTRCDLPWSIKNQARMHLRNKDAPYSSSSDAMTYWVELQAAIGARISNAGDVTILAPFGLNIFFDNSITLNQKRPRPEAFKQRIEEKKWLERWPKLHVQY